MHCMYTHVYKVPKHVPLSEHTCIEACAKEKKEATSDSLRYELVTAGRVVGKDIGRLPL
jgi:hypothetical protein